ncbi:aminopeptidase P family N-terminal domain-containing protein [bacterium]|nr:aminopeptidase P family N-terminal domain-containing protein [bacterium]
MITTTRVKLPRFGAEPQRPTIPITVYQARLAAAVDRLRRARLDALVVYGDREHFANLAYLTGFDPRFEEALLVLDARGGRTLLVGNECLGYLPDPRLGCVVVLFQEFSLLGQPRQDSRPLRRIFRDCGIGRGTRIGCAGWKYFDGRLVAGGARALEVPSYLADTLRQLVGPAGRVVNATALFMDPVDGLRVINEPDQIAAFEEASIVTSTGVHAAIRSLAEGVAEWDLERCYDSRGLPLSCHRMVNFGERVKRGLGSPSGARARHGEPFMMGFGVTGALTCRAGMIARRAADLPAATRTFYPRLAANYFHVVATWYEQVRVGAVAGDVYAAVQRRRDNRLYRFAVNPGHYIHLDEWVHSPFVPRSPIVLRSGMALQMDIIPVSAGPFCYSNAEDGIVLADDHLQAELAAQYPAAMERIRRRRAFMRETLGIRVHESVLPLSNIPGWLPPYALAPETAFVKRRR